MLNATTDPDKKITKKVRTIHPIDMRERISKAAYYLSEQSGFDGNEMRDWLAAEIAIKHR